MSYGKMTAFIDIISTEPRRDAEGFAIPGDNTIASVRAYREDKHGSTAWKNRAAFSTASVLFRLRMIPGVTVTTAMQVVCAGDRYSIISVENVKGRGMYIEILAERVNPIGKG